MNNNIGKQKTTDKIEEILISTKNYKRVWYIILGITILYFMLFGIFVGYRYWQHTNLVLQFMQTNHSYLVGSEAVSYLSLILVVGPYLFLAGCWISGLNNVSKSKHFHLALWIFYAFAYFLIIIGILLVFRAGALF